MKVVCRPRCSRISQSCLFVCLLMIVFGNVLYVFSGSFSNSKVQVCTDPTDRVWQFVMMVARIVVGVGNGNIVICRTYISENVAMKVPCNPSRILNYFQDRTKIMSRLMLAYVSRLCVDAHSSVQLEFTIAGDVDIDVTRCAPLCIFPRLCTAASCNAYARK
jgi:hypothetical protein